MVMVLNVYLHLQVPKPSLQNFSKNRDVVMRFRVPKGESEGDFESVLLVNAQI